MSLALRSLAMTPNWKCWKPRPSGKRSCARHLSSRPYFSKHIRLCTGCSLCLRYCSCFICPVTSLLSSSNTTYTKMTFPTPLGRRGHLSLLCLAFPCPSTGLQCLLSYTLLPLSTGRRVSEHPVSCRGAVTIRVSFLYPCPASAAHGWGSANLFRTNE